MVAVAWILRRWHQFYQSRRVIPHWNKRQEGHCMLFLMEIIFSLFSWRISGRFNCQLAPLVIGFVDLTGRSQSTIDGDIYMVYPITFEVFFQSACPILNCFQWSLPRCFCAKEHLACQVTKRFIFSTVWIQSHGEVQKFFFQTNWQEHKHTLSFTVSFRPPKLEYAKSLREFLPDDIKNKLPTPTLNVELCSC